LNVFGSASFQYLTTIYETASVIYSSGSNQFGDASNDVQTLYGTVKIPVGSLNVTGALNISGSTTQIGTNSLLGNTTLSGSIIISGSTTTPSTPTIKIYGDAETNGVVKFMPVVKNIDTSISASYIYVSGSTSDLYFSQNGNGYNNVTRLRWLEGNLYTGLLHGGIITTQSSTVYQVASGSGIIVNLNASSNSDPYPTVQFLQWNNLSASIASLSASFDQSFISIDSTSNIYAQGIPYTDGDINTKIPIGIVIHQNHSTINAVQTFPSVAYGWKQRTNDFIKAFGPLKISGYTLSPSGSSTGSLVLSGGTAWVDGRNYIIDRNNPSYIVEASGITTSKIYRYYQSGSTWNYDTNNANGYATIDPTKYSNNGVLTSVGTNDWTIQRVYYFPNSATKAFYIYYGNASYANKDTAIAAINTETFSEALNTTANAIFIGYMILRYNADFTVAASYQFNAAGLFRGSGQGGAGGGGGGGTTTPGGSTTQIQYNNGGAFGGVPTLTYDGTTLKVTGSFSGQLTGTSSYSTNSQTSSYSHAIKGGSDAYIPLWSGSSYLTSSRIINGDFAITAPGLTLDFDTNYYSIGRVTGGNGNYVRVQDDGVTNRVDIIGTSEVYISADIYSYLDLTNNITLQASDDMSIGATNAYFHGDYLYVYTGNSGFSSDLDGRVRLYSENNSIYVEGGTGYANSIYTKKGLNTIGFNLDYSSSKYSFGDFNSAVSGTYIEIDDLNKGIKLSKNTTITGSLDVSSGITGSLKGIATTASYISTLKAGSGSVTSFGGSPYTSSITFASAFANNSYAITVTGEDARTWTIQSKSSTGFTINSNSSVALSGPVYWIATPFN